ncbi:MAG: SEC-C metal-binding domain-containing protein [Planctomycetota bacterium]
MRLTDSQIKQGIVHPEVVVRNVALPYFADSLRDDPSVMPLVIQAIETHGWDDAFTFMHHVPELTQTEDSVLWLIDQLNRMGRPDTEEAVNLCWRISKILAMANVSLLMKHEQAILGLEGLSPERQEIIADRLQLMTIDSDTLWRELEDFCEDNKDKDDITTVNLNHAFLLAEAIARDDTYAENVLALLSQDEISLGWMGCLSARLAGEMRLEAAVPLLVAQLRADAGDLMSEECMRSFVKIGTESTVEAICRDWSTASWDYKFYVSTALDNIHCDSVVAKCLELFREETDPDIRRNLIWAVLANFSSEGIEPARQIVLKKDDDLREQLVGAAVLMGVEFPELSRWLKAETKQAEEMKQHLKEVKSGGPPERPSLPKPPSFDHLLAPPPQAPIAKKERVGRNEPCPCGSGKKYKKCCGRDK